MQATIDPVTMSTRTLSGRYGIPEQTLRNMRHRGTGPRYVKVGRSVLYRVEEVERWLAGLEVETREEVNA